jgi:hypothetical protein
VTGPGVLGSRVPETDDDLQRSSADSTMWPEIPTGGDVIGRWLAGGRAE